MRSNNRSREAHRDAPSPKAQPSVSASSSSSAVWNAESAGPTTNKCGSCQRTCNVECKFCSSCGVKLHAVGAGAVQPQSRPLPSSATRGDTAARDPKIDPVPTRLLNFFTTMGSKSDRVRARLLPAHHGAHEGCVRGGACPRE